MDQPYCPTHAPEHAWNRPAGKPTKTTERGYGASWRKLRAHVMQGEPLCRICKADGRITAATEVDHITPKSRGGTDDPTNLQPLCHACHRAKTIADHDNQFDPPDVTPDEFRQRFGGIMA